MVRFPIAAVDLFCGAGGLTHGLIIQFKALGRIIGNAVPVELGRAIGESIIGHVSRTVDNRVHG